MEQNPQQSSSDTPPAGAPGPQGAPNMPPASNYPMTSGGGMVSQDEKTQATLMWALSFFAPVLIPLIFFLISNEKPFVKRHSAMSLALTIACAIGYMISIPLMLIFIGFLTLAAVGIYYLVVIICGAMAASKGDAYDPPLIGKFAASTFKI